MPAELQTTESLAVERLHEWLTEYAHSGGRVEIHHDAESDSTSDVEVVLRAGIDPHLATDRDPIVGNAILGALALWDHRRPRAAEGPTAGQEQGRG